MIPAISCLQVRVKGISLHDRPFQLRKLSTKSRRPDAIVRREWSKLDSVLSCHVNFPGRCEQVISWEPCLDHRLQRKGGTWHYTQHIEFWCIIFLPTLLFYMKYIRSLRLSSNLYFSYFVLLFVILCILSTHCWWSSIISTFSVIIIFYNVEVMIAMSQLKYVKFYWWSVQYLLSSVTLSN